MTAAAAMLDLPHRGHAGAALLAAARRDCSVAVCVPTVDEAATIGPICEALVALRELGACDRVIVVDDSRDDTAARARAAGAEVLAQSALCRQAGPVRGKGDAMWRAVSACDEEVVVFVDGDTQDFDLGIVLGLIIAVAVDDGAAFAKGTYRRPWRAGGVTLPTGGGRVTELTAKPLLRAFFPELAAFGQPLAGELAARTALLRELPFVTGYGVDVALLIDAWQAVGIERMTQVHAESRQNRHRPLAELGAMADQVTAAILGRAGVPLSQSAEPCVERPPLGPLAHQIPVAC